MGSKELHQFGSCWANAVHVGAVTLVDVGGWRCGGSGFGWRGRWGLLLDKRVDTRGRFPDGQGDVATMDYRVELLPGFFDEAAGDFIAAPRFDVGLGIVGWTVA